MTGIRSRLLCSLVGSVYDATAGAFPRIVRVETTNACNAQCIICPHHKMTRATKRMDEAVLLRVIDECGRSGCRELHMHNFGEPFLDKRLERFIAYAKRSGIPKVKVFSNGAIMTRERAEGILDAGLDELKVSFDGASKEEFERIRTPLVFEEVVDNIIGLVELRDARGAKTRVEVACCSTTDKSSTMSLLEQKVDGFSFGKIHNWGTEDYADGREHRIRKPCSRVWRTVTVLANGDVSLCCLDYDGQVVLGNVEKDSIADIYRSPEYEGIRRLHKQARQDELGLCRNCSKSFL